MEYLNFTLKTEYIELFKLLKLTGVCASGGEAKHCISEGMVTVNGEVETRKAFKVRAGFAVKFSETCIQVQAS